MALNVTARYHLASCILIMCFSTALYYGPQPLAVKVKLVAEGFTGPVAMDAPKDGSGRLFVCEQTGKIKVIKGGKVLEKPFLNVASQLDGVNKVYSEKGLLGIAFHPKYKTNGKFFIYFSGRSSNKESDHKSILAEYRVSASDPDIADPVSQRIVMEIEEPESNHNGGQLAFGPDGFLYIGLGDGGGAGDKHGKAGNGQDLSTHLGKILRIDVDQSAPGAPYKVPADNPFVKNKDAKPEIWAYGLRNPWRFSFDRTTGALFCGDVGQNKWEEIDIIEKGKNYGWRLMEGAHCYNPETHCAQDGLEFPIAEYGHEEGISVTGGYVYWGKSIPALQGKYVFADWSGKMFYLEQNSGKWVMQKLGIDPGKGNDFGLNVNSFGEDESGELYILSQKFTGTLMPNGIVYAITGK